MENSKKPKSILQKRKQFVDKQNELNKKRPTNNGNVKNVTIKEEEKGKKNKNKEENKSSKKDQTKEDEIIDEKKEQEEQKKEKQPRLWSYEGGRNEQNMFHGKGVYTFRSGSKYEGEFVNGKREGHGVLVWTNKEKYVGTWKDNKRHGKGHFIHANGDTYEGEFEMDKMHGQGKYVYTCGDQYEGRYVDDKMEAFGTYTWADGSKYVGIRVENKREGEGSMYYSNGLSFKAMWHFNDIKEILEINDPNEKHKIKPLKQDKLKLIKSYQFGVNEETTEENNEKEKEKQKQVKCNLCLIRYKKKAIVKQFPCECKFHGQCADIWIKYDHRCPTCRQKIQKKSDEDEE